LPLESTYFWNYSYGTSADYCAVDGDHHYYFIVGIFCLSGKWTLALQLRDSITDVADVVVMSWNITLAHNDEYSVTCNPMQFHFVGTNGSVSATYSGQTICGLLVPAIGNPLPSITADISLVPACCVTSSDTATLSWGYDGESGQINLFRSGNTLSGGFTCQIGATAFGVAIAFSLTCVDCTWTYNFKVSWVRTSPPPTIVISFIQWSGSVQTGDVSDEVSITCAPLHFHFEGLNTDGDISGGAGATNPCGAAGRTFTFATAGNLSATLDVVTP